MSGDSKQINKAGKNMALNCPLSKKLQNLSMASLYDQPFSKYAITKIVKQTGTGNKKKDNTLVSEDRRIEKKQC